MNNNRPAIPNEIKLQVRQKCKFACVICRCPIYDYEHLVDYNIVKKHELDNIFLLCPTCHRKKTNNNISKETILELFNKLKSNNSIKPEQILLKDFKLVLGNNIIDSFNNYFFKILDKNYFKINKDDNNFIEARFYDNNDKISLSIDNSEYKLFTDVWDISYEGGIITFNNKPSEFFLKIKFDDSNKLILITGKFNVSKDKYLIIEENGIYYNNILLANNCSVNKSNKIGLYIKENQNEKINGFIGFYNCLKINSSSMEGGDYGFVWDLDFLKN